MGATGAVRDPLYRAVRQAEEREPSIRGVLELIAGKQAPATPASRRVAGLVNARRGAQLRAELIARSLTSSEVAERMGVQDRRAVAARRARGTLLGLTLGNETHHPDWQFTDSGVHPDLRQVLAALREVAASPLAADQLMRRGRADLGGRSLADLLADGRADLVVRLIQASAA